MMAISTSITVQPQIWCNKDDDNKSKMAVGNKAKTASKVRLPMEFCSWNQNRVRRLAGHAL